MNIVERLNILLVVASLNLGVVLINLWLVVFK